MIEIELPDGTIAEFPDTMNNGEIQAVLQKQFPPTGRQSYINQLTQGSPERQAEMQRISSEYGSGQITVPEYIFQNIGEATGNISDIIGRGIGDVVGGAYGLLPERTRQAMAEKVAPVGQAVAPVLQSVGEGYSQLKQQYPRTMENVEAGANILGIAAPMAGRAKQISGAIERGGKSVVQKFSPKPKSLNAEDLKKIADEKFYIADQKGGVLKPAITNKFIDDVLTELPQTEMGKVVIGETPVSKLTERLNLIRDKPMSLQAAKEIDEALGDLAYSNINPVTGQLDKQGSKFINIQSKLRNTIENADDSLVIGGKGGFEALDDARKYWSTSLRLSDVEKAIQKGLMAEQPQTGIKNAFKTLLNSKKIRNYSPAEVRAIEIAANKGVVTDLLGNFGSRLNPQIVGALSGFGTANPLVGVGAFAGQSVLSGLSRKAATSIQLKKAEKVSELIRQRVGNTSNQRFSLTPEIKQLAKEVGISTIPAGGVNALLNELQIIQQTGTIPEKE